MLHRQPDPPVPPDDDRLMTLAEVAAELHCSLERIRQIESSGLRKCRDFLRQHGIKPDLLRD